MLKCEFYLNSYFKILFTLLEIFLRLYVLENNSYSVIELLKRHT